MNWKKYSNIWLAVCLLVMTLAVPAGAVTHYVFEGQSIQAAIDDANDGDEIQVEPGTYNEAIDFTGKAVRLYSSSGPEVTTINGTGHYHVVMCGSEEGPDTILEGFTITGGDANGPTNLEKCGGGMYNYYSSPTVTNCRFISNAAHLHGGGMHNEHSNPSVTNCSFTANTAAAHGGGIMNNYGSLYFIVNCSFIQNSAGGWGGGCCNAGSDQYIINCTFSGNTAYSSGGGIFNEASSPIVTDCNFSKNTAQSFAGGGMYNQTGSNPMVTNCSFTGNTAANDGGGIYNVDSSPTITNCTFSGNSVYYCGGGIYNLNSSSPFVTNCTFFGNSVSYGGGSYGGGMYNKNSSNPTVTNCIFWNNLNSEIRNIDSSPIFTYSDIQDGTGQLWFGTGCIDADPCFVDVESGDFHLKTGSPCIDAGDNNAVPGDIKTDLDGKPRIVNYTVDMGAYECCPIHNITQDSWYHSIQVSINDANDGDQIEVTTGTYYEAINFNGRAVRLYSSGGPEVTTINGDGAYHVVQCISGEDANTVLEGFTITGGNANGTYPNDNGGGMYNTSSSPTIINCTFSGNSAVYGGGMYNYDGSSPTVTNCTFSGNSASWDCGGMYNGYSSSPTVTNCNFSGNTADYGGGGMLNADHCSPTVTNCTFSNNQSYYSGAMYNNWYCSPSVTNCTFSGNQAENGSGGGMCNVWYCSPKVTNCILWGNTAPSGSQIYEDEISSATVSYSDVQGSWVGTGNIAADPCFIDANSGDLRLRPDSPCIDAGNNTVVPSSVLKDLAGKLRFADDPCTTDTGDDGKTGRGVVDMGAYEYQGCGITSQNLLANPGFEVGDATGWVTNWGFSLTADTNQVHDGNYSGLASNRTASWHGAWQSVMGLMDDGKTYRISGWVRLQNTDSNYVALTVKKVDSTGDHYYGIDNATAYSDKWVNLDGTLNFDANESMTDLYIYFEGPAADVNFYVDDAAVTEVMGDMNHNGGVDFIDFSLFASYYGFDCSTQDCGRANLDDSDNTINERDLVILAGNWLAGTEPEL